MLCIMIAVAPVTEDRNLEFVKVWARMFHVYSKYCLAQGTAQRIVRGMEKALWSAQTAVQGRPSFTLRSTDSRARD